MQFHWFGQIGSGLVRDSLSRIQDVMAGELCTSLKQWKWMKIAACLMPSFTLANPAWIAVLAFWAVRALTETKPVSQANLSDCVPLPCGPGYGVNLSCGGKCAPCVLGSTYSSLSNNAHVACQPATDPAVIICQSHAKIVSATASQNTHCQCEEDYFLNPTTDRCVPVAQSNPYLTTPASDSPTAAFLNDSGTPTLISFSDSGTPTSTKVTSTIGVGVGSAVGTLLLIILIVCVCLHFRQKQNSFLPKASESAATATKDVEKNTETDNGKEERDNKHPRHIESEEWNDYKDSDPDPDPRRPQGPQLVFLERSSHD
ncbi:uncharacterized protein [Oscarella lobularis]|uniref:uncharacterized protein isoform X2 n=1 Tax=Oscarella lobularis TaxID=121494 RepID=UPI0033134E94